MEGGQKSSKSCPRSLCMAPKGECTNLVCLDFIWPLTESYIFINIKVNNFVKSRISKMCFNFLHFLNKIILNFFRESKRIWNFTIFFSYIANCFVISNVINCCVAISIIMSDNDPLQINSNMPIALM